MADACFGLRKALDFILMVTTLAPHIFQANILEKYDGFGQTGVH